MRELKELSVTQKELTNMSAREKQLTELLATQRELREITHRATISISPAEDTSLAVSRARRSSVLSVLPSQAACLTPVPGRWDSLEDFLIYGLVMLGLIIVPTAIITGTPLDCNFCQVTHHHCSASRQIITPRNVPGRLLSRSA